MSEPLYSVGQHVAVCTSCLSIVIPATTVSGRRWDEAGYYSNPSQGVHWIAAGWSYTVTDCDEHSWFSEWLLRPINPDTEYLDQPESVEQPA